MKVAILGSAVELTEKKIIKFCNQLVEVLKSYNATIMTGGGIGAPEIIALEAKRFGLPVHVYSPDPTIDLHNKRHDNMKVLKEFHIKHDTGFTKRSLAMIQNSDLCIVIGGRMGTLCEFTIAMEEGIPVIVCTNTGGIAESIESIVSKTNKKTLAPIYFIKNAHQINEILTNTKQNKKR